MKNLSENKKAGKSFLRSTKSIASLKSSRKEDSLIPIGSKLNDLYMDAQQVALELNISKRTVRNMRKSGKLSYTNLNGKIFYFRLELRTTLEANKVPKKDSI
jgi:transcriptional antiterminator